MKQSLLLCMLLACGKPTVSTLKEPWNTQNDPTLVPGAVFPLEYMLSKLPNYGREPNISPRKRD